MTTTQISFLGRATAGQYREANYRFPDGHVETDAFFGLALGRVKRPERMVVLGTSGSMWDVFIEHFNPGAVAEEQRLALMEAAQAGKVGPEMLQEMEPLVSEALGLECRLRLMPYGADEGEQQAILATLAEAVAPEERVVLDVTHGLRHLPMLGFLSALYLRSVRGNAIDGIYYGALDMTGQPPAEAGQTPVLRLEGLLDIADWIQNLHLFDERGDFGAFADSLSGAGLGDDAVEELRKGAFCERINDVGRARGPLEKLGAALDRASLQGPASLFAEPLRRRLDWAGQGRLAERQAALAWFHLDHGDYLRAATLGYEAFITRQVPAGSDPMMWDVREAAREGFRRSGSPCLKAFNQLADLRNAMAHGSRARSGDTQATLHDEEALEKCLSELFTELELARVSPPPA